MLRHSGLQFAGGQQQRVAAPSLWMPLREDPLVEVHTDLQSAEQSVKGAWKETQVHSKAVSWSPNAFLSEIAFLFFLHAAVLKTVGQRGKQRDLPCHPV